MGVLGFKHSEETKLKMSLAHQGMKNSRFGTHHSEESKKKMSLNHADITGDKHPYWKGGRVMTSNGYVQIFMPNHPQAVHGYVKEHRLVMEQTLGRYLTKDEIVHHINGDKIDNRIANLMLFKNHSAHTSYHWVSTPYNL